MEVPVRRILSGAPLAKAANRDAMANPAALDFFIEYVQTQQDYPL
jgi:acetoacetyl-CoA synthetase